MKNYPVIKFTILFIFGILFHHFFVIEPLTFFISVLLLTFSLLIFSKLNTSKIFLNILAFIIIILFGNFLADVNQQDLGLLPQNLYKQKNMKVYGTIYEIDLPREYEIRFKLKVDSFQVSNSVLKNPLILLTRIRDDRKNKLDSIFTVIKPGYKISVIGTYFKGREIRNPGEFDYNNYLHSIGISGLFNNYDVDEIKIINKNVSPFKNFIFNIRKYLNEKIIQSYQPETAALIKGLLLADRSGIDYETKTEFINSGVIHVLAVSGLHTGFIIIIFLFVFGRFNIYVKSILTIIGLILFLLITGMPASVFRASIMAIVFILALLSNRTTNLINALAIAALILLIIKPSDIYSPGFQLSFSAVLAIAVIFPLLQSKINSLNLNSKSLKYILFFISVSLAAQIGTLPFTLYYFGKLSLISLFANLVVIPAVGAIVGISIFTLILNFILPFIAAYYAAANDLLSEFLFWFVSFTGNLDFSFIRIRQFSIYDGIIFYIFLSILIFYLVKFKRFLAKLILIFLVAANTFLFASIDDKDFFKKNELNVLTIDVGQGDAILIKFPNGKTALIDAGNADYYFDNGERVILPLLDYLNISQIDYGFVSHLDADHYGGFVSLVHQGKVKKIFKPQLDSSLAKDLRFENYLKKMNVPISYYKKESLEIGNVKIYVLNDNQISSDFSSNDKSGIIKVDYGNTSFLFTGDAESKAENFYVNKYKKFLKADVLKVGHHGSNTSTTPKFILNVKPSISIISAGIQNQFGHPSSLILNHLNAINSKIYRTDLSGAILLTSNGDTVNNVNWKIF
ncbi:MAG: DNA internalization-related competence protein ComEC/Rec2 [Ignavibacteriaceae bacterium]